MLVADRMQEAAEKLLERFGDQLFVRHAAITQQEGAFYAPFLLAKADLLQQPLNCYS
jgi:hypothetical protein